MTGPPAHDRFDAFCPDGLFTLPGAPDGPLVGLKFAAKDNLDVAGHVTGAGSPDWLRTHGPAEKTAPAVQRLLDAGATLIGKTQMDELAFSLAGQNAQNGRRRRAGQHLGSQTHCFAPVLP